MKILIYIWGILSVAFFFASASFAAEGVSMAQGVHFYGVNHVVAACKNIAAEESFSSAEKAASSLLGAPSSNYLCRTIKSFLHNRIDSLQPYSTATAARIHATSHSADITGAADNYGKMTEAEKANNASFSSLVAPNLFVLGETSVKELEETEEANSLDRILRNESDGKFTEDMSSLGAKRDTWHISDVNESFSLGDLESIATSTLEETDLYLLAYPDVSILAKIAEPALLASAFCLGALFLLFRCRNNS